MNLKDFRHLFYTDLYRYEGKSGLRYFLKMYLFNPGVKYTFHLRLTQYLMSCRHKRVLYPLYVLSFLVLIRKQHKYGIVIPAAATIGSGLCIGHFGTIIVNARVVIGMNCNICQGVTIGQRNRGKKQGYPVIGDNVYIGPGAKIIGAVRIGDNVAIGANCVVTGDIPDNAVVVGVPGKVISDRGSRDYVNFTDYEKPLAPLVPVAGH